LANVIIFQHCNSQYRSSVLDKGTIYLSHSENKSIQVNRSLILFLQ